MTVITCVQMMDDEPKKPPNLSFLGTWVPKDNALYASFKGYIQCKPIMLPKWLREENKEGKM